MPLKRVPGSGKNTPKRVAQKTTSGRGTGGEKMAYITSAGSNNKRGAEGPKQSMPRKPKKGR